MTVPKSLLPTWFPSSIPLDQRQFGVRHRILTVVLMAQLPFLVTLGLLTHHDGITLGSELVCATACACVGHLGLPQTVRASAIGLGLMLTAAALVDTTGGQTAMYLDFLIMLGLVALYQNWIPLLLAIVFVGVHQLVMSVAGPASASSGPDVSRHPFQNSLLHAGLVLAMALVLAANWRFTEQANAARRRSEQRLRSIFDQAPVGIAIIAVDGTITEVNPALATMLGFQATELAGVDLATMVHPDSTTDGDTLRTRCRGHDDGQPVECAYLRRDGSPAWARVTVGPLSDDSEPNSSIEIVEDLHAVKQREVDLRHAQKLEAVGKLANGIAHEINTPSQFVRDNVGFLTGAFDHLAAVIAANARLCRPIDEQAADELAGLVTGMELPWLLEQVPVALGQSVAGLARIASIVAAMRSFGHPDGASATPTDIDAAIRDTVVVARNEYKYVADLELELGQVPAIMGYPSQFHQVMLNLVVNAAQAIGDAVAGTTRRGTIRIRSWADDTAVHVSVIDTGVGMSQRTLARVFEPFFTTKPAARGTGQGLAVVHSVIVDKHHGAIEVTSTPGLGSTFTLHLPRTADGLDAEADRAGTSRGGPCGPVVERDP